MNIDGGLTAESVTLLRLRGRSTDEINAFSGLLNDAQARMDDNESAKQILASMDKQTLQQVQEAAGLVDRIQVSGLSKEAAINLLAQPDKSNMVDLDNDGLVEIGAARAIVFPPVNAPSSVKAAWEEASANMSEQDKLVMQLQMHTAVYGVHIEGIPPKEALPPDQQWGEKGVEQLFNHLRSALEFAVSLDGWTDFNQDKRDFYDAFESALTDNTQAEQVAQTRAPRLS